MLHDFFEVHLIDNQQVGQALGGKNPAGKPFKTLVTEGNRLNGDPTSLIFVEAASRTAPGRGPPGASVGPPCQRSRLPQAGSARGRR